MTQGKEQVSCRHPKVDYECEFAKKTVYMIDYGAPVRFDIIMVIIVGLSSALAYCTDLSVSSLVS